MLPDLSLSPELKRSFCLSLPNLDSYLIILFPILKEKTIAVVLKTFPTLISVWVRLSGSTINIYVALRIHIVLRSNLSLCVCLSFSLLPVGSTGRDHVPPDTHFTYNMIYLVKKYLLMTNDILGLLFQKSCLNVLG